MFVHADKNGISVDRPPQTDGPLGTVTSGDSQEYAPNHILIPRPYYPAKFRLF